MTIPILGQSPRPIDGPTFRLLFCLVCKTLEELPPYEGDPKNDTLLEIAIEKHVFPSGEPHKGRLFVLPVKTWMDQNARKEILKQIHGGGSAGLNELDNTYYDTKSTFSEDALTCWKAHNKPTDSCDDYCSDRKLLLPKTEMERKELGLPSLKESGGPKNYLCHFCPIHVKVTQRKRKLMGMYD